MKKLVLHSDGTLEGTRLFTPEGVDLSKYATNAISYTISPDGQAVVTVSFHAETGKPIPPDHLLEQLGFTLADYR